jgi:hypothetical protein
MCPPVTRGELQDELKQLRAESMQQQLQLALARHANAIHESMVTLVCSHDEKYADLPERVHLLESAMFAQKHR